MIEDRLLFDLGHNTMGLQGQAAAVAVFQGVCFKAALVVGLMYFESMKRGCLAVGHNNNMAGLICWLHLSVYIYL